MCDPVGEGVEGRGATAGLIVAAVALYPSSTGAVDDTDADFAPLDIFEGG